MECPQCGHPLQEDEQTCPSCSWTPRMSGLATASAVLGVVGILLSGLAGLVGLILAVVARSQIRGSGGAVRGRRVATVGLVLSSVAVALMPAKGLVLWHAREKTRQARCIANMRELGLGLSMYVSDHDEMYPPADNWADGMEVYVRNYTVFQCPSLPSAKSGYALNEAAGCRRLAALWWGDSDPPVVLFEATGGWNLAGGPNMAEFRHYGGLTIGSADGGAEWLARDEFHTLDWGPREP